MSFYLQNSKSCGPRYFKSLRKSLSKDQFINTTFSTMSNRKNYKNNHFIISTNKSQNKAMYLSINILNNNKQIQRTITTNHKKLFPMTSPAITDLSILEEQPQIILSNGLNDPNEYITRRIQNQIDNGIQDAFFIVDLGAVIQKHELWNSLLPRVRPFYAVKCNPDIEILRTLGELGCGFDCASKKEIDTVLNLGLVSPQDIIFANPCKQISHLEYSKKCNVHTLTFDSIDELNKIKKIFPNANLILRLLVDDSHSQCQLGSKYGAPMNDIPELLRHAKKLNLNIVGLSFHVGSGCYNVNAFSDAVKRSRIIFDMSKKYNFNFNLLDIGGGFPGNPSNRTSITFHDIAKELKKSLDFYFPEDSNIDIISEPGRYFVASSHTLTVNIIGKKNKIINNKINQMYYINDGLYGSFNCVLYDHATISPIHIEKYDNKIISTPLINNNQNNIQNKTYLSSIWGPTCDGFDCIIKDTNIKSLNTGDWMYFNNMGAYTAAAGSQFNGFSLPEKTYINSLLL